MSIAAAARLAPRSTTPKVSRLRRSWGPRLAVTLGIRSDPDRFGLSSRLGRPSRRDPLLCPTLHVGVDCLNLVGGHRSLECGHSPMGAPFAHNLAEFFRR